MSNKKYIESSAKTIEDAIASGLEQLDLSIGDVDVDIIDEGSKGLFGLFGSKQAKVRLTVKDGVSAKDMLESLNINKTAKNLKEKTKSASEVAEKNNASMKKESKVAENSEEAKKESCQCNTCEKLADENNNDDKFEEEKQCETAVSNCDTTANEDLINKSKEFLSQLTKYMGVDVDINPQYTDDNTLFVDMQGDELGILIGRHGETLEALQHITKLVLNKGNDEFTRILLDSENYRARREESLVRFANRMANRAIKTGRRVSLDPMNPYERRIIHSALQKNEQVSTHSEGEEPRRRVVITLKQK